MIKLRVQLKDMSLRNHFVKRVFRVMKDPSKQGFSQTFKLRGSKLRRSQTFLNESADGSGRASAVARQAIRLQPSGAIGSKATRGCA